MKAKSKSNKMKSWSRRLKDTYKYKGESLSMRKVWEKYAKDKMPYITFWKRVKKQGYTIAEAVEVPLHLQTALSVMLRASNCVLVDFKPYGKIPAKLIHSIYLVNKKAKCCWPYAQKVLSKVGYDKYDKVFTTKAIGGNVGINYKCINTVKYISAFKKMKKWMKKPVFRKLMDELIARYGVKDASEGGEK